MPELEGILDGNSLTAWELILAALVVVLAGILGRWLRRHVRAQLVEHEALDENMARLLARIGGWMVMLLGVLFALSVLGFDIGGVVLLLLFALVMLALAGKGILENFAAGMLIQIRAPFRVGDRIEAKGYTGIVEKINGHAVVIETDDHRTVHVPNKEIIAEPIVSFTDMPIRRSEVEVGIAYDTDLPTARSILVEATARVEGVLDAKQPRAFVREFADSSIGITVYFWHNDGERIEVRGRVAEAIKTALDGAGIEIPFPQRVVTYEDTK